MLVRVAAVLTAADLHGAGSAALLHTTPLAGYIGGRHGEVFRRLQREPPLEPLDIWVWEVAAANGMLSQAICLDKPLIQGSAGSAGHIKSVKDEQDDPRFLTRVYNERGYGKVRDP